MHTHSELPSLRATIRVEGSNIVDQTQWYDCKFYPYTPPGEDPVFAAVGGRFTIICRCILDANSTIEVLRVFEDDQEENRDGIAVSYNSVEWSQAENGDALVCITGNVSQIKVLNVMTGELVTTLIGHGADVNDLAISPVDPTLLASASVDHSVRIWSLDPAHERQPTAAICFGQGHKDQVLSIAYHRKGQYILSAGMDTRVNLWKIPDDFKDRMGTDKPALIHYPHFSTTEIHTDFVDCVRWYNDIIVSHAAREHTIQMWKIDNFNSDRPPPNPAPISLLTAVNSHTRVTVAASSVSGTRSAWGGRFQRLLQFSLPDHDQFYMRFDLFHELGAHPILVAGNEKSKIFLWDLQRLEELKDTDSGQPKQTHVDPKDKKVIPRHVREQSSMSNTSGISATNSTASTSATTKGRLTKPSKPNRGIGDPFHSVDVHSTITVPKYTFAFRQFAWSRDGQWCVGVGDFNCINVLHRWEHGVPPPEMSAGKKAQANE